jgi:hypothetical protein
MTEAIILIGTGLAAVGAWIAAGGARRREPVPVRVRQRDRAR